MSNIKTLIGVDLEGAHEGCNYLAVPGSVCTKCGQYVPKGDEVNFKAFLIPYCAKYSIVLSWIYGL